MCKLEKLIQQFCPDGVEYINLNKLCSSITTGKLNANQMDEDGIYPFFTCDSTPYRINTYAFDTIAIIISGNGSQVGHINYYNGKFNAYQRTYVLSNFNDINIFFLLHFLKSNLKSYIFKNSKKGSIPYITMPMLENYIVPVPPLEIQEEIVIILDQFSELNEVLRTELVARKKQFEFYRNSLLNFDDMDNHLLKGILHQYHPDGVEYKELSTLLKIKNGKDYKMYEEGDIPVYGTGGVMTYIDRFAYDGPSVLIPRKGSLDKLYYVDFPFWTVDTLFYTEINVNLVIPKFVFYYLQFLHLESLNTAGGVPSLTQSVLNRILFPTPNLEVQKEMVRILDQYESLVNDMKIGLPAEIEARQKQYEYYRDKLLTFKELES